MNIDNTIYILHCMSPVHVGAGQGVGAIDMPMIREKVTQWPYIPGSSVKGVHREYFRSRNYDHEWMGAAFGIPGAGGTEIVSEGSDFNGNAGALVMSDARMLAFPVASGHGTFAYVTCPLVLKRLYRDLQATTVFDKTQKVIDVIAKIADMKLQNDCGLVYYESIIWENNEDSKKVILEEFDVKVEHEQDLSNLVDWIAKVSFPQDKISQTMFKERVILVSDEAFQYFVTMCSEVVPRIRIKEGVKIVEQGALWNEEYLPVESILYGIIWCDPSPNLTKQEVHKRLMKPFSNQIFLQIGGNATVGKGRVRCSYVQEESQ